ncbi:hypothetical protein [Dyadobacter sp. CY343]|uniref:hypothetical protein n=1 Tax=Dyadobacter sp. CY343 TaxID=2907299 RepID=UPI001F19CF6A|nr:hypothetical protein [Dyadobacter sp. CY343]MCE7061392.1 hypothetical protein [Dyadobacter sp. CY343]
MLKKLLLFAWIGSVVLFTSSCEGPEGPQGEVGPQGVAGPAGPAGPAGQDGQGGGGGAGSIIAFMGEIETDTAGNVVVGDTAFFSDFTDEEVASVEKGAFQVYIKDDGGYFPIPGTVLFEDEAISYSYYYVVEGNGLYFPIFRTSNAKVRQRTFEEIRVLVMPALNLGKENAKINWKNYDEAVKALGLSESDVKVIRK